MVLGKLGASLLENLLPVKEKEAKTTSLGRAQIEQMKVHLELLNVLLEQVRILMLSHPLRNFEIEQYHQNEPKFNEFIPEIIYQN